MCDNVNDNPFAGLFSSINDAVSFSSQNRTGFEESSNIENVLSIEKNDRKVTEYEEVQDNEKMLEVDEQVNHLLEEVFEITLHPPGRNEISNTNPETNCKKGGKRLVLVNAESMELAVFERLMMSLPETKVIRLIDSKMVQEPFQESRSIQRQAIPYLFESYCRLKRYQQKSTRFDLVEKARHVILQNTATSLQEPDLFEGQKIHDQFLALFMSEAISKEELSNFVCGIVSELCAADEKEEAIAVAFGPILDIICKEALLSTLVFRQYWFDVLHIFSSIEPLAKLILHHSTPKDKQPSMYMEGLLGALFSLSCLPKKVLDPYAFFDKPLQQSSTSVEVNIWTAIDALTDSLQKVFHLLLKCSSDVRHLTLKWISDCLHANANRGKTWHMENNLGFGAMLYVSDGFMLNLGTVLLRLCQPFCLKEFDTKVPKIDPTYCAADIKDDDESRTRGVHLQGMTNETCLIPIDENAPRPVANTFGFTTECFFLTHRALDLGYRVVVEKLSSTYQSLARIQRVYNDAQTGGSSEALETITRRMEVKMTEYLSLRASLLAPEMLKLLARFHATTAFWLVQVYIDEPINRETEENGDYIPREYKPVTFPLPDTVPNTVRCIPEFVVENTIPFLCFLRRLSPDTLEEQGQSFLEPVMTEIIVLMESQRRLYNPHLRARLAEGLEALLPTTDENGPVTPNLGTFHRQELFMNHPHKDQIVPNLLQVFVSIEMTGQSVQFEQKFNYRRPMYDIMEYLWQLEEHRNNFIRLAEEAEVNMEAVQPPLFLRFINLLMNDAVFLLDEALSKMAQLRQMLQARENGEWDKLPAHEREQQVSYLQYIGMIARFDNILGRKTIQTLKMLTSGIKSIFCHPTMVDRIASMLNYLLLHLVGPNKKNFKVNDQKEYAFNPANLVLNICEIYINLSESESFTLAVSQDGRSYSPELFELADNVLVRIGGVGILGDLDQFAKKVEASAAQKKQEDEILTDAPEEFLDPIMSTLMTDPVILPSSKIAIDRQTIARHLLSDQTDPFNRSHLTMDMIKSDVELRCKIETWIKEKKQQRPINTDQ